MTSLRRIWLTLRHDMQRARTIRSEPSRHLRAVARALLTGDTSHYRLTPTLPRRDHSTAVDWGDDDAA